MFRVQGFGIEVSRVGIRGFGIEVSRVGIRGFALGIRCFRGSGFSGFSGIGVSGLGFPVLVSGLSG